MEPSQETETVSRKSLVSQFVVNFGFLTSLGGGLLYFTGYIYYEGLTRAIGADIGYFDIPTWEMIIAPVGWWIVAIGFGAYSLLFWKIFDCLKKDSQLNEKNKEKKKVRLESDEQKNGGENHRRSRHIKEIISLGLIVIFLMPFALFSLVMFAVDGKSSVDDYVQKERKNSVRVFYESEKYIEGFYFRDIGKMLVIYKPDDKGFPWVCIPSSQIKRTLHRKHVKPEGEAAEKPKT